MNGFRKYGIGLGMLAAGAGILWKAKTLTADAEAIVIFQLLGGVLFADGLTSLL